MYLGIDVGTISVKIACLDEGGALLRVLGPERHEGRPAKALAEILKGLAIADVTSAAVTGAGRPWVAEALGLTAVNGLRALSRAFATAHPEVRMIVEIGGRDSKLIVMREIEPGSEPVAVDAARSALCAAGTGSFLDQQAMRLGFAPEELGAVAMTSDRPANVSGRCSVFAKSDLIHLQQVGTRDSDMLAGLCYAVVRNFRASVAKGRKVQRPLALCGGVALNECVRRAVLELFELGEADFVLPERPAVMSAIGAGLVALESARDGESTPVDPDGIARLEEYAKAAAIARRLPPLGEPSHPASAERRVFPLPGGGERTKAYLGVDIGSISTKAAVIDPEGNVVARRYFWTAGRPLEAVRRAMKEIGEEIGQRVEIAGVGTTGSGRYLVGDFIGADVIKNEITAQARASVAFDPTVDTVFEIGGQDSKFIVIRDGAVVDFAMNKVCAAGTGSFLTEQSERMGIDVEKDFARLAFESREPIDCGERCTVFMDTDVANYIASGASTEDISAGLAYSIAKNYLSKVADRGKTGRNVVFQGAVAFNDSVVAAFEKELGRPVRVTRDNELTGCIGVAMIARDETEGESAFRGFGDIAACSYEQSSFTCEKCANHCDVKKVEVEGRPPSFFGDRCDRYQTKKRRDSGLPDLFAERTEALLDDYAAEPDSGPVVGIPRALAFLEVMPFWRTLVRELGGRTVLSRPTARTLIERAADHVATDTCLPIKVVTGHVMDLIDKKPDFILMPVLVDRPRDEDDRVMRYNCPFVQVWGHLVQAGLDLRAHGTEVLQPILFYAMGAGLKRRELKKVADALGAGDAALERAIKKAEAAQGRFVRRMSERGREVLADLPGGRAVVVAGRPYNACDPGLNLDLPKKLRDLGILPVPMDCLPLEQVDVHGRWKNMFWHYGRAILSAADIVGSDDRLELICVTNFRCGPDSVLAKYGPEALRGKPFLLLEFDDHSADAGVLTRVEAYLDSRKVRGEPGPPAPIRKKLPPKKGRRVFIPHMGDMVYAGAAACRSYGVPAEVIHTDDESLALGRQYSSGKECLPYVLCVGNVVKTTRRPDFDPEWSGFFMASTSGPCRLGQYEHGLRRILDDLGYKQVPVISVNQGEETFKQLPGYRFARKVYLGIIATCELQRLARQHRPFEAEPGTTDRVYRESLEQLCHAIQMRTDPYRTLRGAAKRFRAIETVERDRPRVCLVGEAYVRMQPYANCHVIRKLEALGGEVFTPSYSEWMHHVYHCQTIFTRENRLHRARFGVGVVRWITRRVERRVQRALGPAYRDTYEPSIERIWENAERAGFIPFFGDASLTLGLSVEMAERGIDGIINVMPFTCMVGSVARSQLRRAASMLDVPVLDVEFDGRGDEFLRDELEMFMDQVKERRRIRQAGASARGLAVART
ncbi:MAG: acyl-CoA dehydratase activase [Planctomycetota bacterium]|jgi:predicted CoA-substrate-specific enzyme activase